MLYRTNRDLPTTVQDRLPESAQDLYRIAFNSALHWYGEEEKAHRTAWSAVRNQAANLNCTLYSSHH
jgi:cation transport regulator